MKTQYRSQWFWLLLCGFITCPIESYGQWPQASIALNNFDPIAPIYFWSGMGPVILAPVDGTYVQVLARRPKSAEPFQLVGDSVGKTTLSNAFIFPGYFDAAYSTNVPGVEPNEVGEFYVRAWRGASTWEEALQNPNAYIGQSEVFQDQTGIIGIGNVGAVEASPGELRHLRSFTILPVPEPSVLSLGLVGVLCFWPLVRRRAKNRSKKVAQ